MRTELTTKFSDLEFIGDLSLSQFGTLWGMFL